MKSQYSINLNYEVINQTFSGGQQQITQFMDILIEKMLQSSCEVKLETTQEGRTYTLMVKDDYVNQIIDKAMKNDSLKDTILNKISKLINNNESELKESLKGKVEDFLTKTIETRLLALNGIPGLIMMKDDQLLALENTSTVKLKM